MFYITLSIFCIINVLHGFIIAKLWISSSDQQINMDSTKSGETLADDPKIKSDLLNRVEKLQIELHVKDQELQVKDEELAKEKEEKQVSLLFAIL
jgi:membrane protein involved in colicin uptake